MVGNGEARDVVVYAPVATAHAKAALMGEPTPQEMIGLFAARIRELEAEVAEKTVAAGTLANVAGCMARRLIELGHGHEGAYVIPRGESARARGTQVTVGETADGDIRVYPRDQDAHAPLARE